MTFERTDTLRELFNVVKYWATAAGFGLAIPMLSFLVALFWWLKCQHLWATKENKSTEVEFRNSVIDWIWLT
jgi:hypothetical protein